jgi:hypothetical protein
MSLDIQNALSQNFTITNTWQRYTWTVTPASNYTWVDIQMAGASVIELYGFTVGDSFTLDPCEHLYQVYEQSSNSNLNPLNATLIEVGILKVTEIFQGQTEYNPTLIEKTL